MRARFLFVFGRSSEKVKLSGGQGVSLSGWTLNTLQGGGSSKRPSPGDHLWIVPEGSSNAAPPPFCSQVQGTLVAGPWFDQ